jgi:hypothetical protein
VIPLLVDADVEKTVESKDLVTLPSGLQYRDIVLGNGPMPPIGYQVSHWSQWGGMHGQLMDMDALPAVEANRL